VHLLNPQTMDLYCCLAQESMRHLVVFSVSMATTERVLASNFVVCMTELTSFNGQKHLCVKRAMSVSQIPANTMAHVHLLDLQHSRVTVKARGSQDQLATLEFSPLP